MTDENAPLGLAAAARIMADPEITVATMRQAIAAGRLHATEGLMQGFRYVTLADVRKAFAPPAPPAPVSKPPIKIKK